MHTSGPNVYSTGSWRPFPGQEDAFLAAWEEFATWTAAQPGAAQPAILASDVRDAGRYVSFLGWDDMDALRGWKGHPEFKERMGRVQKFVDKFAPTELDVVRRARSEG